MITCLAKCTCVAVLVATVFQCSAETFGQTTRHRVSEPSGIPIPLVSSSASEQPIINVKINGKGPYLFLVDTGAQDCLLDRSLVKELGLKLKRDDNIVVSAGALSTPGGITSAKIQLGPIDLDKFPFLVTPESSDSESSVRGTIGMSLMKNLVVRFDRDKRVLTIWPPHYYHPATGAKSVKLDLDRESDIPTIRATVDGIRGRFTIDTGNDSRLALYQPFARKYNIRKRSPRVVHGKNVYHSVAGDVEMDDVRIHNLKIGSFTLHNTLTEIFCASCGDDDSDAGNIGSGILGQFRVTFDFPHRKLYLAPNSQFDAFTPFDRTGMVIHEGTIHEVIPYSPAAAAQLQVGDQVVALDGHALDSLSQDAFHRLTTRPAGATLPVTVERKGKRLTIALILKDIL